MVRRELCQGGGLISPQFKNNYCTHICSRSSYLRLIDFGITQLVFEGNKEEKKKVIRCLVVPCAVASMLQGFLAHNKPPPRRTLQ